MKIKNEAELLNKFCSDKDDLRPFLEKPFYNTKYDKVWCTNGYALLEINPKVLTKKYHEYELRLPELEYPCKKKVTIEAINKALEECPKVDEEIVVSEEVKCKECEGYGEVTWEYTDNNCHTHELEAECPICYGKGYIIPEKTKKTGRKITKEDAIISIGNALFFARNVNKLKFAMDFLNIKSAMLTYNPKQGANKFVLNEDVCVFLSPMYSLEEKPHDAVVELTD